MGILAAIANIITAFWAYNKLSHCTGFAHHCTTIYAMYKVLFMNGLIITALVTCGVLLRTAPHGI
jgi:hypothetical protein